MTNEEKAREIQREAGTLEDAALMMAEWKDKQLKKVCKRCEQHIIDSGRCGCAYRSLAKEYCWED